MQGSTPTSSGIALRRGDFTTLRDALDYAADGHTGLNFYSVRGDLTAALPYRRLREAAIGAARRLVARGFRPGERVALVAETHPAFVCAFFACQYAGLIPAPLPLPAAFGGRTGYVAHTARLLLEARAVALIGPANLVEWLAPEAGRLGLRLCDTFEAIADPHAPEGDLPAADPDAIAYLQFSSGSTRFPIGIVVHQRALMANLTAILTHGMQVRAHDRAVSWLPFYHDMGLVGFLLSPLAGQFSIDLMATQDFARRPQVWLSLISEQRGTIAYSPSFGFDLCLRRQATTPIDLSCWRIAGIGGDMIRPVVLEAFARMFEPFGFRAEAFVPSYGMAEATLAITFGPLDRGIETDEIDLDRLENDGVAAPPAGRGARARSVVLCGRPLPLHEIEIRGTAGQTQPERRVGRVFARGPSLMQGYDGRPEETEAVLSPEGWLDTGDLGYRLGETLVITGRAKDLIIINGRNIWPQDLEWTVERTVSEVRTGNVAAFSVEEDGREVLILAAEARLSTDSNAREAVITAINGVVRLEHGLDARVMLLAPNTLPYTSSGKLSRSGTRLRYLAGTLAAKPIPA